MFPPAINRLPKLTYIGGGSERWVVGTLHLVKAVRAATRGMSLSFVLAAMSFR